MTPLTLKAMPASPRSILKRPSPLPLSPGPFPFSASFSVSMSPGMSPHVHFPPSPLMTSSFSVFSPGTYDRSAIKVTPNPLAIPAWGERVFSPTEASFSAAKRSPAIIPITKLDSPLSVSSGAYDSGEIFTLPPILGTPRSLRFVSTPASRLREDLGKALSSYPRSPYPSAPSSPVSPMHDKENVNSGAVVTRARSLTESKDGPLRRGRRPASLNVPTPRVATPRVTVTSPLSQLFLSPVVESPMRTATKTEAQPAVTEAETTPNSARLSRAFWQSVSLAPEDATTSHAQSYPTSADMLEPLDGSTPMSSVTPPFIFGTRDGALWSPGLPRREEAANFLLSPTRKHSRFGVMKGSMMVNSPLSDYHPIAALPTFSAALAGDAGMITIQRPPPVIRTGAGELTEVD